MGNMQAGAKQASKAAPQARSGLSFLGSQASQVGKTAKVKAGTAKVKAQAAPQKAKKAASGWPTLGPSAYTLRAFRATADRNLTSSQDPVSCWFCGMPCLWCQLAQ